MILVSSFVLACVLGHSRVYKLQVRGGCCLLSSFGAFWRELSTVLFWRGLFLDYPKGIVRGVSRLLVSFN